MKRRTFLTATAATGIGSIAGCLGDGESSGSSDGTGTQTGEPTDSTTDEPARSPTGGEEVSSTSLEATGDCSSSGSGSVSFESSAVVVTGCIQGPNGCHQPVLREATMNGDTLEVVVTTEEQGGDMCTQALVQRGYEATVSFGGGLPATVTVVHDSMGEQTTVATADR
jgi:hypothetical protein